MKHALSCLFVLIAFTACSKNSNERLNPSDYEVLHLTSVETEKRHEERLWNQLLVAYNGKLKVAPNAVDEGHLASREVFDSRLKAMKEGFNGEINKIRDRMKKGDNLYYFSSVTEGSAEFGYLIERDGYVVYRSGFSGVIWD